MTGELIPVRTVDEALRGFRPRRRTAIEGVPLAEAVGRVPPGDLRAPASIPGQGAGIVPGQGAVSPEGGGSQAGGLTVVPVRVRPRVAIVSTGGGVVPSDSRTLPSGHVRDATGPALSAAVREAGGSPNVCGIVPADAASLCEALQAAHAEADLVVICSHRPDAVSDLELEAVASLGGPGIWCHGLAMRPGESTLLAECGGVPVIGLSRDPLAAVVVFRLIGIPLLHLLTGCTAPPPPARTHATLAHGLSSAPGRLDIVQVRLRQGRAEPLNAAARPLSTLAEADGYVLVPSECSGLFAGAEVDVELYR